MLSPLTDPIYRRLFSAQVFALIGTGLTTVALGLLAFELAGQNAGAVLGTALAIKMIAYVGIAPVANAIAAKLPRRPLLVSMDIVRAAIALFLPFVSEIWQIYVLIFVLQACSAVFTPTFQAIIPDILDDEAEYTKALSLSRLAYDLESLLSPMLAAALLTIVTFQVLFVGNALGFILSALIVIRTAVPAARAEAGLGSFWDRTTRGLNAYLRTPRLRGLLALNLSVAAAGAMVIVNSVVLVQGLLGRPSSDLAFLLAAFGGGSMVAALLVPRVLERFDDRQVMIAGAGFLSVLMLAAGLGFEQLALNWPLLLAGWFVMGVAYSSILTPTGRLLRRSAQTGDRAALFAAQFALSHACWLITYPLAGWLGAEVGLAFAFVVLGSVTVLGTILAMALWPRGDGAAVEHFHTELPAGHPHLKDAIRTEAGWRHAHVLTADELHVRSPG